jgi:hypothetical protein
MADKALFNKGEPTNLPAAALDALEWLEWLYKYAGESRRVFAPRTHDESMQRLGRAVRALKEKLKPHLPHQHEPEESASANHP